MNKIIAEVGTFSEKVKEINHILSKLGYRITSISNNYDEQTKISVASFQNDAGLGVTGQVDSLTYEALKNNYKSRFPNESLVIPKDNTVLEQSNLVMDNVRETRPTLRVGSSGFYVVQLQEKLVEFGFLTGLIDGKFGQGTKNAVINFQKQTGLSADGVVGQGTWNALDKYVPNPNIKPMLRRGDTGRFVTELQLKLMEYGFLVGPADGKFGLGTETAVMSFQRANGLTADGVVGQGTWNALDNYIPGPIVKPTLRRGDAGRLVTELQLKLMEYGFLAGPADGKFGLGTETAVMSFQRANGLTADGVVGQGTWNALDNYIPGPIVKPTLRRGDAGRLVTELQLKLMEYGFLAGPADGKFGQGTETAVKSFQRANGLTADGVVGQGTWKALDAYTPDPNIRPVLREGDQGDYVVELQQSLINFGYLGGIADGIFSSQTEIAVKTFQKTNNLPDDGVVGPTTWFVLDNYKANPNIKPTIRQGNTGNYVRILQDKLIDIDFLAGPANGVFDQLTTNAVKEFQSASGLTADGVVGTSTWFAFERFTPGDTNRPILRQGSSGEMVKKLQYKLKNIGVFIGQATGFFGVDTEAGVKKFQYMNGLAADGVVGQETWRMLDRYPDGVMSDISIIKVDNEEKNYIYANQEKSVRETTRPTLRQGDSGQYVINLQKKLIEFGFLTGSADGKFGAGTKEAVIKFQKAVGVSADGVVGQGTWYQIDTYIGGAIPPKRPTLRQGDTGSYVVELQTMLIKYGFLKGSADGKFGAGTKEAVIKFQKAVGLSADGVVGQGTWKELDYYTGSGGNIDHPTLRQGDSGDDVVVLQELLKKLKFYHGVVDGKFGAGTKEAVILFQSVVGLTADGVVGKKTWLALESHVDDPSTNYPTIREGSTGEYVIILQQKLKDLGFFSGNVDGKFGPATKTALKLFQSTVGLTSDGVCGSNTWEALFNYTGGGNQNYPTIRQGSSGEYVLILQQKLKDLGFFKGIVDGLFGPATTTAVIAFQKAEGLKADGVVGKSTWDALLNNSQGPENYPSIRLGDTGSHVTILQTRLSELGYYYGGISGVFDKATEKALMNFQEANNLTPDGVCGKKTWVTLFPSNGEGGNPSSKPVLRYGDTGEYVKYLQEELKKLMYYDGEITGVFDNLTLAAVKAFQANNRLPADGVVGLATWSVLQSLYPPVVKCD